MKTLNLNLLHNALDRKQKVLARTSKENPIRLIKTVSVLKFHYLKIKIYKNMLISAHQRDGAVPICKSSFFFTIWTPLYVHLVNAKFHSLKFALSYGL